MEQQEYQLSDGTTFSIFDHIDQVVVGNEQREAWLSKEPKVWPSAASVELFDQRFQKIAGKCMRSVFLGMIGYPSCRKMSADAAWKMIVGKLVEAELARYSKQPRVVETTDEEGNPITKTISLHAASGVRVKVDEVLLSFELDLVALDPHTFQGIILEEKTFSSKNYAKFKEIIKDGKPGIDNLIQVCIYLMEIQTGARLKSLIAEGIRQRQEEEEKHARIIASGGKPFRKYNRIEVTQANVDAMDDGPLAAKLAYLDRSDGLRREMNISIEVDELDELTYPVVDGQVWKLFPLESIYVRFKELQGYFYKMRQVAEKMLYENGIEPPIELIDEYPDKDQREKYYAESKKYYDALGEQMRSLPASYWPPAEYEFEYSADKIEAMYAAGQIAKTKYEGWKKKHKGKERIGDWQCRYCDHQLTCLRVARPDLVYLLGDVEGEEDEVA